MVLVRSMRTGKSKPSQRLRCWESKRGVITYEQTEIS